MHVKDYDEAVEAITDIVLKAKIPVITMVAILEVTKHRLLRQQMMSQELATTKAFLAKLQKEAEAMAASKGVS